MTLCLFLIGIVVCSALPMYINIAKNRWMKEQELESLVLETLDDRLENI